MAVLHHHVPHVAKLRFAAGGLAIEPALRIGDALMFAVNDKVAIRLPAATGTRFHIFAGAQGRKQDLKTPV